MRNSIKCLLNDEITYLPIAKSERWLNDERYYEVRKTLNGALVAWDVTDL